jgi:hypothetical protein
MRSFRGAVLLVVLGVCFAAAVEEAGFTPVLGYVNTPPRTAKLSDGQYSMLYELLVVNAASVPVSIEKIEVRDKRSPQPCCVSLAGKDIESVMRVPGETGRTATLAPAQSGIILVNIDSSDADKLPGMLVHSLSVRLHKPWGPYPEGLFEQRLDPVAVSEDKTPVIGPPLRGDRWIAAVVCGKLGHRTTVMPIDGKWVTPERFAVDWIRMDEKGRLLTGDLVKNESYPQYGQEILAVSSGVIIRTVDDRQDEVPGKLPDGMTLQKAAGNMVLQDIGNGYSAVYAHIKPGTMRVKAGQKVKRGEVLGLLGNSGNSDGPHLHFHVVKGRDPLASDGAPYVIDSFILKGIAVSKDNLETELQSGATLKIEPVKDSPRRRCEMPANLSVVEFK